MFKYVISFLFILLLSTPSFAKIDEMTKLKKEYGQDLSRAPFFLRFAFYKRYNVDWKKSFYSDRKEFLIQYEKEHSADLAHEKELARAEAQKESEIQFEKKEELRKERDRLKVRIAKEKAEKKEEQDRQKNFKQVVIEQEKELKELERQIAQKRLSN